MHNLGFYFSNTNDAPLVADEGISVCTNVPSTKLGSSKIAVSAAKSKSVTSCINIFGVTV